MLAAPRVSALRALGLCTAALWLASASETGEVCTAPETRGTGLLQRGTKVAHRIETHKEEAASLAFEPVDGGEGRSCRGAHPQDKQGSHYTLFRGVTSLGECKARCEGVPDQAGSCPRTEDGHTFGKVSTSRIDECSGLAASRRNSGLYWINNDSGDRQRLYAIDKYGTHKAQLWVNGADAHDWEDVAIGPGPARGSYIYVADTGDNRRGRSVVQIYRFLEPEVPSNQDRNADIHVGAQRFDVKYPDGAHDCEAMFVDQGPAARQQGSQGRVYIVTKGDGQNRDPRWRGGDIYWVDLPEHPAALTFQHAGHVPLAWVTGADIDPSGSLIVLRTYGELLMWPRANGASVERSLTGSSCSVHRRDERQGEAVCFGADGSHYLTVSEGSHPAVWYFALPRTYSQALEAAAAASTAPCHGIDYAPAENECEVWHRRIQATVPLPGHTCLAVVQPKCGSAVMQDVERVCPSGDGSSSACKVLATGMRGKTCRDYCRLNNLECAGGWEEENENCVDILELGCDRSYGTTSDLICECVPQ